MHVSAILGVSILLQLSAAVCAVCSGGTTDRRWPWLIIAFAPTLMAGHTSLELFRLLSGGGEPGPTGVWVSLAASSFLLAGIAGMATVLRSKPPPTVRDFGSSAASVENERTVSGEKLEREVAEHRRTAEALSDSEQRFRRLVENSADAILLHDLQGRFVDVNDRACASLGYSREELLTLSVLDIETNFPLGSLDRLWSDMSPDRPVTVDGTHLRRDGISFPVEVRISKFGSGEKPLFLASARDVTERRNTQDRLLRAERLAAVEEAMKGLAHESRNALQRSQATLERLGLRFQDHPEALALIPEGPGSIREIQSAQDHVQHLYEEVRSYAEPIRLRLRRCDLAEILEDLWSGLSQRWEGRDASFRRKTHCRDVVCEVDGDSLALIFRHILENSLSACSDPVEIVASFLAAEIGGRPALEVSLLDNGPGLTAEAKRRVFEPFFTSKARGTGLGMVQTRRGPRGKDSCSGRRGRPRSRDRRHRPQESLMTRRREAVMPRHRAGLEQKFQGCRLSRKTRLQGDNSDHPVRYSSTRFNEGMARFPSCCGAVFASFTGHLREQSPTSKTLFPKP